MKLKPYRVGKMMESSWSNILLDSSAIVCTIGILISRIPVIFALFCSCLILLWNLDRFFSGDFIPPTIPFLFTALGGMRRYFGWVRLGCCNFPNLELGLPDRLVAFTTNRFGGFGLSVASFFLSFGSAFMSRVWTLYFLFALLSALYSRTKKLQLPSGGSCDRIDRFSAGNFLYTIESSDVPMILGRDTTTGANRGRLLTTTNFLSRAKMLLRWPSLLFFLAFSLFIIFLDSFNSPSK